MEGKGFFGALFDFSFSEFVTTKLIKLLYLLSLIFIGIGFVVAFIAGFVSIFTEGFFQGLLAIVFSPIIALIWVILARVWMELIIVIFRIAENTTELVRLKESDR